MRLGRTLRAGDTVCLYGDLGSGKTTFTKGVGMALGLDEKEIASASFTIVAEYETEPPLYHIDLYRLETGADLDSVGIYEYVGSDGIAVIEWAEWADPEAMGDTIDVHINFLSGDKREIIIEGIDEEDRHHLQKGTP